MGHGQRFVVKTLCRGDADSERPEHWTYWRREALAYQSGLLPRPGTVDLLGVDEDGDTIRLTLAEAPADDHTWTLDDFAAAAAFLGEWQSASPVPDGVPWLAGDQLAQRIARTDAAGGITVPPPLDAVWARRWELIDSIRGFPAVLTHGDFSRGNLTRAADGSFTVIDWATLGRSAAGFDLAHLVLSAWSELGAATPIDEIESRLCAAYGRPAPAFAVTVSLTAISRRAWYVARDPVGGARWDLLTPWLMQLCAIL